MATNDHPRRTVAFPSPHRTQSRLEPTMITLNAIVRILLDVVEHGRHEPFDRSPQRWGSIGHHLDRCAMRIERRREEPTCSARVAPDRDVHLDDLACGCRKYRPTA
jgi:hypothetical protein